MSELDYDFVEGTPGVTLDDVAHLMIPGRFRSEDGMGLSDFTTQRADTAGQYYTDRELASEGGVIVASGYKTPNDHSGEPWRDELGEEFEGIPESYSVRFRLLEHWGISVTKVRVDPHSVDTVTNFTNTRYSYPDERPVAIVAQEEHLERILDIVAPKTMRQPYVGLVVPELPNQPDKDGVIPRLVSRYVAYGLTPETLNASTIAEARVLRTWQRINALKSVATLPATLAKSKA